MPVISVRSTNFKMNTMTFFKSVGTGIIGGLIGGIIGCLVGERLSDVRGPEICLGQNYMTSIGKILGALRGMYVGGVFGATLLTFWITRRMYLRQSKRFRIKVAN